MFFKKRNVSKNGFTLIEMLVAIGLVGVFTVLVAGSFVTLTNEHRVAREKERLQSELRFLLDTLGREITWAAAITQGCSPEPCTYTTDNLTFVSRVRPDTPDKEITYRYDAPQKTVFKKEQRTFGMCSTRPVPASCEQQTLSQKIAVDSFQFIVANNEDNVYQPKVTVAIQGTLVVMGNLEKFSLSSSFTPRYIQNQEALGMGPMTPYWQSIASYCTSDADSNGVSDTIGVRIAWVDDATHHMHIERCIGSGCTSFTEIGTVDSSPANNSYQDGPPLSGGVYRYRIRLHDHNPTPPVFGDYLTSNNTVINFASCGSGSGSQSTARPTASGGSGGGSSGGGTGEQ